MWKKLILGGVAVAATGYGIKKLCDLHYEDELKAAEKDEFVEDEFKDENDRDFEKEKAQASEEAGKNGCCAENLQANKGTIFEIKDENGNVLHLQTLTESIVTTLSKTAQN